jgi:hypothetical protein
MKTTAFVLALGIAAGLSAAPALAAGNLVQFDGGIGVVPLSSGVAIAGATTSTTVNRNFVRGVPPPGQPWVIRELKGAVKDDGRIRIDGRGLLLSGGNGLGGNAGASVFATLICEAAAPFVERSTAAAGVALEPNGDFLIDDILDNPASECASPVLLIRSTANKGWFAAGIPRR